ncbi:MAG: hypothetical protein JO209_05685 [Acidisphaera sp.]|nr:hypothetical protein [Acidisphaera sp.]
MADHASAWSGGLVVASAPVDLGAYAAAVLPIEQFRFGQLLFGFEAQLSAFARVLQECGCCPVFAPAPELFSTTESYRHLAYLAGVHDRLPGVIHVRFGMASHVRLLKNAENLVALAEHQVCRPVNPTPHPFGAGDWLPAGVSRVLLYDAAQAAAARFGGEAVPTDLFPPHYVTLDVERAMAAASGNAAEARGLSLCSLAEYEPLVWSGEPADCQRRASRDWRAAMARGGEGSGGFVLVPWNLAHPASIVPDLVLKLCRSAGQGWDRGPAECRVVLFPYNATPLTGQAIGDLLARLREGLGGATLPLRRVFLARLHALEAAGLLAALFPLAWLEAGDPECRWNEARLAAFGIGAAVIGGKGPPEDGRLAAPGDETLGITVSDQFGERLYVVPTLSVRGLAALRARSLGMMREAAQGAIRPGALRAPADPALLRA